MSKIRNPHLIPTGTLLAGTTASGVNVEKTVAVEKGITDEQLSFIFPQAVTEKQISWYLEDLAARNTEYSSVVVGSDVWAAGTTQKPYVGPSIATIETAYGVNLDVIDQITIDSVPGSFVNGVPSATTYRIVFVYEAIGFGPKNLFWNFSAEGDRDTVFGELTNVVGDMTFL